MLRTTYIAVSTSLALLLLSACATGPSAEECAPIVGDYGLNTTAPELEALFDEAEAAGCRDRLLERVDQVLDSVLSG